MNQLGVAQSSGRNLLGLDNTQPYNSALGESQLSPAVSNDFLKKLFTSFIKTQKKRGEQLWSTMWKNKHAVENWGGNLPEHEQKILAYWTSKGGKISRGMADFYRMFPTEYFYLDGINRLYENNDQRRRVERLINSSPEGTAEAFEITEIQPAGTNRTMTLTRAVAPSGAAFPIPTWMLYAGGTAAAVALGWYLMKQKNK